MLIKSEVLPEVLHRACLLVIGLLLVATPTLARSVQLSEGELTCEAPDAWRVVKPANRLIEQELAIDSPSESKVALARLTMMQAGGSVDANIARWIGQFSGNVEGADQSTAEPESFEVDGMTVTIIDLEGTYVEALRGPFGPKTNRNNYRLVGAIIETGTVGNYFFKLIGPKEVVSAATDEFQTMIKSLKKTPVQEPQHKNP